MPAASATQKILISKSGFQTYTIKQLKGLKIWLTEEQVDGAISDVFAYVQSIKKLVAGA